MAPQCGNLQCAPGIQSVASGQQTRSSDTVTKHQQLPHAMQKPRKRHTKRPNPPGNPTGKSQRFSPQKKAERAIFRQFGAKPLTTLRS
ncbi:hypothetical protein D9Q98_010424 [Chlorella vulgaris]|uniref:Uncharacterized protein n=1 Tax=Chlorella vulgaris TaxID=3077 RepID=A0A9D4TS97_CHLVU|nr:hypothetical protein D9Q98_010424 [Chlorella vulgaris]